MLKRYTISNFPILFLVLSPIGFRINLPLSDFFRSSFVFYRFSWRNWIKTETAESNDTNYKKERIKSAMSTIMFIQSFNLSEGGYLEKGALCQTLKVWKYESLKSLRVWKFEVLKDWKFEHLIVFHLVFQTFKVVFYWFGDHLKIIIKIFF